MSMFLSIILVFGILVLIHELGHFLAAKWMGVRVEKFSIGFPPTIWSKKIGDTEFAVSAIPLGGYVKMAGFIDESMDTEITGAEDEFNSKPVWRRMVIITAGVIMNLILAVAILAALNFYQGERIIPYTEIGTVPESGVAERIGFQKGDRVLAVNDKPVQNWNELTEAFIQNLNNDIVFEVNREGETIDLVYQKEWFQDKHGEQLDITPRIPAKVGDVSSGMPASALGLQRGDQIVKLSGEPVEDWDDMTKVIEANPGKEIMIQWRRDGELMSGTITPKAFEQKVDDKTAEVGKIGIAFYMEYRDVGFGRAIVNGFTNTYKMIALNVRGLWWVLTGTKSASEIMGGPITIAKMAADAADAGWLELWYLIAVLSAILAFFNILPIPALDGGHLFFLIIEGIIGKPIPSKAKIKIQQVGMAILLTVIVLILYVDLKRFLF